MQFIAITSVEGWDFAFIALPEVITLVLCVLRRRPVVFVGVVGVHFGGQDFTPVFLSDSGLSINEVKGWNDSVVRRKYTTTYLSSHWSLIPPCHHQPAKMALLMARITRWESDWRLKQALNMMTTETALNSRPTSCIDVKSSEKYRFRVVSLSPLTCT